MINYEEIVKNLEITAADKTFKFSCVSMGNPHVVMFVDDVKNMDLESIGPKFENHQMFPNRTNAEFVKIIDDETVEIIGNIHDNPELLGGADNAIQ